MLHTTIAGTAGSGKTTRLFELANREVLRGGTVLFLHHEDGLDNLMLAATRAGATSGLVTKRNIRLLACSHPNDLGAHAVDLAVVVADEIGATMVCVDGLPAASGVMDANAAIAVLADRFSEVDAVGELAVAVEANR
jgi:predicted ATP-dependent serine protease